MARVQVSGLTKKYGAFQVMHGVSVESEDGEFVVLVGPSGSGKSTLLRMIAGLEEISEGEICIGGHVVNDLPPKERDIAMVFQSYALYPHKTVAEKSATSLMQSRKGQTVVMGTPFMQLEESLILGSYDALLFDMDGTILTSIAAAERAWSAWAARVGISAYEVLSYVHGRTAVDTIRHFLPPTADINAEVRWLDELELADLDGIAEVPGAGAFLRTLPTDRWAVVTSANRVLATKRIMAAGLPLPSVLVSSDDVSRGKPDPEGYLRALQILGVDATACLVFEDTHAGMRAGLAAGAEIIQIAGTQKPDELPVRMTVESYQRLSLSLEGNSMRICVSRWHRELPNGP
jgi:sugar-phosphatase